MSRLLRFLARMSMGRTDQDAVWSNTSSPPLDLEFYKSYYSDLEDLDDDGLRRHFRSFGHKEGRFSSPDALIKYLEASKGPLPSDFNPDEYGEIHSDLSFNRTWRYAEHYLLFGRSEGRSHRCSYGLYEEEFAELVARGILQLTFTEECERAAGLPIPRILTRRAGLRAGPWLYQLQFAEFRVLNQEWAGPLISRAHAVAAFLEEGIARLAPLSLSCSFDPEFYVDLHPTLRSLAPEARYRDWLNNGSRFSEPPSGETWLRQITGSPVFPEAFQIGLFRRLIVPPASNGPASATQTRSLAADILSLSQFMDGDYAEFPKLVQGPGAGRLWEVYAKRARVRGRLDVAHRAYENALQAGATPGRVWHQLGDLAVGQGLLAEADNFFTRALQGPHTDRWSYIEGAKVAAQCGHFARALSILTSGRCIWSDMEPWRRTRRYVLQAWLDTWVSESERHNQPASASFLKEFQRVIADDVPMFSPRSFTGREILILCEHSWLGVSTAEHDAFTEAAKARFGPNVRLLDRDGRAAAIGSLPWASCVVLHEVRADVDIAHVAEYANALSIPVVYWIGSFDGKNNNAFHDRTGAGLGALLRCERALLAASLCRTGYAPLPAALRVLKRLTRDRSASSIGLLARADTIPQASSPKSGPVLIVVPRESSTAEKAWKLLETLLTNRSDIRLILGDMVPLPGQLLPFADRIRCITLTAASDSVLVLVSQATAVVEITGSAESACTDALFGHLEASALGVACLRLDEEASTGANTCEQPAAEEHVALEILTSWIEDPTRAKMIGRKARSAFEACYPAAGSLPKVSATDEKTSMERRRRILIVNVFFPPQNVGGATKVVTENLDFFIEKYGNIYEFAVLTSDNENATSGVMRIDGYRGVPVFRISTPQEVDMDWRPHNPVVGHYASQIISLFRPDLVHIHCLQRLSVAVAEACQEANVPYIITLHDAWWLSDYSFLVDEDGRLCLPKEDLLIQDYSRRIGITTSVARGARLRAALRKARILLSVSESFADVYRACGFDVRVNENGIPQFTDVNRVPGNGRVRLLHVGGLQQHKGAYLLEAALRAFAFSNLELTIIDFSKEFGDHITTTWGNTPVHVLGKMPPSLVPHLYCRSDVLVAPSTWPESFGLVSREAAAHGCWIVASRLGAMGEIVTDGRNGHLIDVSDARSLFEVLRQIDANPARYSQSAPFESAPRSSDAQAIDLLHFYQEILHPTN